MAFDVFRRAWAIFRNPKYLGPALLIATCIGFVNAAVIWSSVPMTATASWFRVLGVRLAGALAVGCVAAWPMGSLTAFAIALGRNEDSSLRQRFLSFGHYAQYVVVSLAVAIAVGIATLFLIVPG